MADVADAPTSFILLEELFESGDPRFLDEVLRCHEDTKLKALARKWYRDRRPFARRVLLAYVDDGCDRPRHRALVRALLRLAESESDDELMAHFLCAFDRLQRHELKTVRRYDYYSGRASQIRLRVQAYPDPKRDHTTEAHRLRQMAPKKSWRFASPWFSAKTRQYLKRRTLRYFRYLAFGDPTRFFAAMQKALPLYRDAHLPDAVAVLDVYGLTNLLYGDSPVLRRTSRTLTVGYGKQLAELEPAPIHPEAWRGQAEPLLRILFRSDCVFVRRFLMRWLEREEAEALRGIDARKLIPLLLSGHADVQVFAVKLLESADGLGALPVTGWLELLALDNGEVLRTVCALVEEHVSPERLELEQLVSLACARPLPVAELGFGWLKDRAPKDAEQLHHAMRLADAECESVRADAVRWLLGFVTSPLGAPEHLRDLIDARYENVRALALELMASEPRFGDAPSLWLAVSESPYPDVLRFLLGHLEAREAELPPERVERVWATTLLSVHRGSHAKRAALRQIASRVTRSPERADALLPILRVALRSVREAERRAALGAVAQAAFANDGLRDAIGVHIPELRLFPPEGRA